VNPWDRPSYALRSIHQSIRDGGRAVLEARSRSRIHRKVSKNVQCRMRANRVNEGFVGWYARGIRLSQRGLSQERDYDLRSGFT
jgi:hypothetical protein